MQGLQSLQFLRGLLPLLGFVFGTDNVFKSEYEINGQLLD